MRDPRERSVRQYGRTAFSFDALQCAERYTWFASAVEPGAFVPYRTQGGIDIVLGEPLCPIERMPAVVAEFVSDRREQHRALLGFCATEPFARASVASGAAAVEVLAEPEVDPSRFEPRGGHAKKLRSDVRRLEQAGFQAVALPAHAWKLPDDFCHAADELVATWLARGVSRSAHVLNLDAWRLVSEKRYFAAFDPERPQRLCSLLIAHPVYGRSGYHLCHIVRHPSAPRGASELVVLKALRTFRDEGVSYASFGPVARPRSGSCENLGLIGRAIFGAVYPRMARLGHFTQAAEFRRKFHPGPWSPRWIVVHPPGALGRSLMGLLRFTHVLGAAPRTRSHPVDEQPDGCGAHSDFERAGRDGPSGPSLVSSQRADSA